MEGPEGRRTEEGSEAEASAPLRGGAAFGVAELAGLYTGHYGVHGTEVIRVECTRPDGGSGESSAQLIATKVAAPKPPPPPLRRGP